MSADERLLVEMRRHLHAHPELSGAETSTTAWIGQHLHDLGLSPRRLDVGTGLVCDITIGDVGPATPVVALRADIDALAMDDGKDGRLPLACRRGRPRLRPRRAHDGRARCSRAPRGTSGR